MVYKLTGYILTIASFLGVIFLRNYNGVLIPYPILVYVVFIVAGFIGVYTLYKSHLQSLKKIDTDRQLQLDNLKSNSENICLTIDTCKIVENNYFEEAINDANTRTEILASIYNQERQHKQNYIEQSAIIYYYTNGPDKIRMTSQVFPFDAIKLTNYIKDKKVMLYVNHFDKTNYAFELLPNN